MVGAVARPGGGGCVLGLLFRLLLIGVLLLAVAFAVSYFTDYSTSHGLKHIGAADIRTCIDNGGAFEFWHNPTTNREAWLCMVQGKFGIAIRAKGRIPITEFVKEKMKNITQVRQYLRNAGYLPGHLPGFTP